MRRNSAAKGVVQEVNRRYPGNVTIPLEISSSQECTRAVSTVLVPGTGWRRWFEMYRHDSAPMRSLANVFGQRPVLFKWSGLNSKTARQEAATALAREIDRDLDDRSRSARPEINLVGFSHGGNVAALATRILPAGRILNLVTIATPVVRAYQPGGVQNHVHVYNPSDAIQGWGGEAFFIPGRGTVGRAKRQFAGAANIAIDIKDGNAASRHGNLLYCEEMWERIAERLIR